MLTDIFAERYARRVIWERFTETEAKLLMQCYRIVAEQLIPYWNADGKAIESAKPKWKGIHDQLSMELGLSELAPLYYSYQTTLNGQPWTNTGCYTLDVVCKTFVTSPYSTELGTADRFIKERLSFVELAFRLREEEITSRTADLPAQIAAAELDDALRSHRLRVPGSRVEGVKAANQALNATFRGSVDELNERFRRAGAPLNYHNRFIQIASDALIEGQIEEPFWRVVADPRWKNVDTDMKEALDRRDANDRDPALYASKALESTIKIISDEKHLTRHTESGAAAFIDNLGNAAVITTWERDALKKFFAAVRNPLGHGPGNEPMPELTLAQTNWAIESCMSWIRSLIERT
jgi:hypothetical protein